MLQCAAVYCSALQDVVEYCSESRIYRNSSRHTEIDVYFLLQYGEVSWSQWVAVCGSVWLCVAVNRSVLQGVETTQKQFAPYSDWYVVCVSVCCSALKCVCGALHVEVCCSESKIVPAILKLTCILAWQCVAVCCSVLQCVAACCSQSKIHRNCSHHPEIDMSTCVAVCCSMFQCAVGSRK